ncbi:GNAT family N-acetyltransferase [Streptococcus catagoni]|uniref:GNAT family N-acetyltransferase n=1 Tax=Streptococcus catagoni TaxID=2654874 RepID=UPI00140820C7|nr:GNAT family N-acetyltransferase [Streptococcus catagoni]
MVKLLVGTQPFQRAASLFIRYSVFVLERNIVMAEEFDTNDEKGTLYSVIYDGDLPVSTGRFLPETDTEARISRVATLREYRGQGYGAQVIAALENYAESEGYYKIIIHSELSAKTFYESIGYQPIGEVYEEDGEPCQSLEKMIGEK